MLESGTPTRHGDIWDRFNTGSYFGQNYESAILPEDLAVLGAMAKGLTNLGVTPYSQKLVADVGCGGAFPYSGILQRLVRDDGIIQYIEYGPNGVRAIRDTLARYKEDGDMGMWCKFGGALLEIDGRFGSGPSGEYVHPTGRSFSLGTCVQGSVYELPPDTFDSAATFYCPESITNKLGYWLCSTERFVDAVKPGGLVVMTAMINSDGYTTPDPKGKLRFPAVRVDAADVEGRLSELGVVDIHITTACDPEHGMRPEDGPGYEGVCLAMGIRRHRMPSAPVVIA